VTQAKSNTVMRMIAVGGNSLQELGNDCPRARSFLDTNRNALPRRLV
jgi:hypothetical protein